MSDQISLLHSVGTSCDPLLFHTYILPYFLLEDKKKGGGQAYGKIREEDEEGVGK